MILKLGLLPYRIGRYATLQAWTAALDRRVAEAASAGAQLLVLPEYASMDAVAAPLPSLLAEINAACDQHDAVIDAMRGVAERHSVWLLGGSLPVRRDGALLNRAALLTPDGRVGFQDKHVLTRFERELWGLTPGQPPGVFDTQWGRLGVAVCYDVEFPPLVRAQVEAGAWLILVPAATDSLAGFNRVRLAARARALENQCFVAVAPTVGAAPWLASLDVNHGYAAVFGPVDRGFPDDGVIVRGDMDAESWVYADLDPARLDAVRADGAVFNHRDYPPAPPPCPTLPLCR